MSERSKSSFNVYLFISKIETVLNDVLASATTITKKTNEIKNKTKQKAKKQKQTNKENHRLILKYCISK